MGCGDRMANLSLEVKIAPGTSVEDAAHEMINLSNRLGSTVEAKFNGTLIVIYPGPKTVGPDEIAKRYLEKGSRIVTNSRYSHG